jgi:hypothetical protein
MAIDRIEPGFATLQYEIVEERASALGRMGRRLEAALAALSGCDSPDPKIRSGLLKEARHSFWLLVVQREASGFNNSAQIIRDYAVPDEVHAQLGLPLTAYPMRRRRSFQAKTSQRATYRNEFRPSGSGDMA